MPVFRNIYILPALILAAGLPAGAALLHYRVTGDPTLRPLGLSKTALTEGEAPAARVELVLTAEWGRAARLGLSEAELRRTMADAVSIYDHNVNARVGIRRVPGADLRIFVTVGSNRLGPYRLDRLAAALPPALAAYRMQLAADTARR